MLKCLGCACYPSLRDYNKHKFDYHASKCIFIGYSLSHKGYKCLHSFGHVYVARHVVFYESSFPFSSNPIFNSANNKKSIVDCSFSSNQAFYLSTLLVIFDSLVSSFESFLSASSSSNTEPLQSVDSMQANIPAQSSLQSPNSIPVVDTIYNQIS